jgi:hypothetical protein
VRSHAVSLPMGVKIGGCPLLLSVWQPAFVRSRSSRIFSTNYVAKPVSSTANLDSSEVQPSLRDCLCL